MGVIAKALRRLRPPTPRGELVADSLSVAGIGFLATAGFEVYGPAGWVVLGGSCLWLSFGVERGPG